MFRCHFHLAAHVPVAETPEVCLALCGPAQIIPDAAFHKNVFDTGEIVNSKEHAKGPCQPCFEVRAGLGGEAMPFLAWTSLCPPDTGRPVKICRWSPDVTDGAPEGRV